MVKAELSYNPYLLETIVRFNEQAPRVNSLIEKYRDKKLQEWIDILPSVFHDEMNGYDFEFDFSGVESDFSKIKESFFAANASEDEINFFYKNELESPAVKSRRIKELIGWLNENKNGRFDFEAFKNDNKDVFDTPYTLISVRALFIVRQSRLIVPPYQERRRITSVGLPKSAGFPINL